MKRYLLSGPAKNDLRNIVRYIRERNPDAAKRVRIKFHEAMRRLAEAPGLGHSRQDLADESLRVFTVYSYLVIYRSNTNPIEVVRVVHGARELRAMFEEA